jgi:hypothetical protein
MYGTLPPTGQIAGIVAGGLALAGVLMGLGIHQGGAPSSWAPAHPAAVAAAPRCRVVVEGANVRAGPSADADVVEQVGWDLVLPCAPEVGGWRRVEAPGGTPGFVRGTLLEPLPGE